MPLDSQPGPFPIILMEVELTPALMERLGSCFWRAQRGFMAKEGDKTPPWSWGELGGLGREQEEFWQVRERLSRSQARLTLTSATAQSLQPPPCKKKKHREFTIPSYIKITPSYIHIIAVRNILIFHT